MTSSSWMWEEYSHLYNPFPTEQQKISLHYTSDQNSSNSFCCTSRVLILVSKSCLCPGSCSPCASTVVFLLLKCTDLIHPPAFLLAAHLLTTPWLGWPLLILQSSVPISFPSRSHPWANNAQSKLAEGAFLYLPSLYSKDHFIFSPELSKSETVLSLVPVLINGLLSF